MRYESMSVGFTICVANRAHADFLPSLCLERIVFGNVRHDIQRYGLLSYEQLDDMSRRDLSSHVVACLLEHLQSQDIIISMNAYGEA